MTTPLLDFDMARLFVKLEVLTCCKERKSNAKCGDCQNFKGG